MAFIEIRGRVYSPCFRSWEREGGSFAQRKSPSLPIHIPLPGLGQAGMDVPHTIDSDKSLQHLPEDQPLAVVPRVQGVRDRDRFGQYCGQGLGILRGTRGQETLVPILGRD